MKKDGLRQNCDATQLKLKELHQLISRLKAVTMVERAKPRVRGPKLIGFTKEQLIKTTAAEYICMIRKAVGSRKSVVDADS